MTAMTQARRKSLLGSGSAQFAGQFLGLLLAILVSHLIARRMGVGPQADAFLLGRRLITAVTEALNQIVMPALEILRRAETEAMRDAADDLNRDAIEKRILHSPTYVVGGTRIDGQEHIDRLRDVLGRAAA